MSPVTEPLGKKNNETELSREQVPTGNKSLWTTPQEQVRLLEKIQRLTTGLEGRESDFERLWNESRICHRATKPSEISSDSGRLQPVQSVDSALWTLSRFDERNEFFPISRDFDPATETEVLLLALESCVVEEQTGQAEPS